MPVDSDRYCVLSSRLCQETITMKRHCDSAVCRYHKKRQSPPCGGRWVYAAVGVETWREEQVCHPKCPYYRGKIYKKTKNAEKSVDSENVLVDLELDLNNLELEIVPLVLRARDDNKVQKIQGNGGIKMAAEGGEKDKKVENDSKYLKLPDKTKEDEEPEFVEMEMIEEFDTNDIKVSQEIKYDDDYKVKEKKEMDNSDDKKPGLI